MAVIEKIEPYKGGVLSVSLSDGKQLFVSRETALEYNLSPGLSLPDVALAEIERSSELRRAKERALYLLDGRDYSYVEMFKKLSQSYSEDICYEVMERLVGMGLIDDRRYAALLAEQLCVKKKHGVMRAKMEMRQKGIPEEIIAKSLGEYDDSSRERLAELIERKYRAYLDDEKGLRRVKAALYRLGYSYEDINAALDAFLYADK